MFYGRAKLTARMLSTLHRNSLMITGERRIGKTTFLHHLKRVLAADEGGEWTFFPVFVDLQGVPEQAFFHALMAETVDSLELLPATRAELRFTPDAAGYDARDFSHDLQRVIAELKTAHAAPGEAGAADRRGRRAQLVLRERQPAPARDLHEELLGEPGGGDERRRDQAALEERGQPLVQLLRRGRARPVLARGGRGAGAGAGGRLLPVAAPRRSSACSSCRSCAPTWCRSSASTRSTGCWSTAAARSSSRTSRRRATSSRVEDGPGARDRRRRPRAPGYGRLGAHVDTRGAPAQSLHRRQLGAGRGLLRPRRAGARGARGRAPLAVGARRAPARQDQPAEGARVPRPEEPRDAVRAALLGPAGQRRRARPRRDAARERRGLRGLPARDRRAGRGPREPAGGGHAREPGAAHGAQRLAAAAAGRRGGGAAGGGPRRRRGAGAAAARAVARQRGAQRDHGHAPAGARRRAGGARRPRRSCRASSRPST